MSNNEQITPPPELVQQWLGEFFGCTVSGELSDSEKYLATQAAHWGADQELEACCALMDDWGLDGADLCAARRPKPPSLKKQALADLDSMQIEPCVINGVNLNASLQAKYQNIRRALEALPDD